MSAVCEGAENEGLDACPANGIDLESSHQQQRAKILQVVHEEERRKKEERRKRRELGEASQDAGALKVAESTMRTQQKQMVEHIEFTSEKFGFSGGDEFKQVAMADESHLEQQRLLQLGKDKERKQAEETARFEAEQAALEEQRKHDPGIQAVIEKRRRAAEEAERAKKKPRPGVRLAVIKKACLEEGRSAQATSPQHPAAPAGAGANTAECANNALGLGLGGYASDDESDEDASA